MQWETGEVDGWDALWLRIGDFSCLPALRNFGELGTLSQARLRKAILFPQCPTLYVTNIDFTPERRQGNAVTSTSWQPASVT